MTKKGLDKFYHILSNASIYADYPEKQQAAALLVIAAVMLDQVKVGKSKQEKVDDLLHPIKRTKNKKIKHTHIKENCAHEWQRSAGGRWCNKCEEGV